MGIKRSGWAGKLKKIATVGLDSAVLIYHLEDIPEYADLTEVVFAAVMDGSLKAILSTITVTELLVRPYSELRMDQVTAFERFLFSLPDSRLIPPDYPICKEAARLRSKYKIRTPDAIILATCLREKAGAFLTNDAHLSSLKEEGLEVVLLDDFIE